MTLFVIIDIHNNQCCSIGNLKSEPSSCWSRFIIKNDCCSDYWYFLIHDGDSVICDCSVVKRKRDGISLYSWLNVNGHVSNGKRVTIRQNQYIMSYCDVILCWATVRCTWCIYTPLYSHCVFVNPQCFINSFFFFIQYKFWSLIFNNEISNMSIRYSQ